MNRFKLEYDTEFGIDRRSGWSIAVNGEYLVSLEPNLVVALWKAWWKWVTT